MSKVKIAIQGELGAYSHIAANDLFKEAELKTCATFEETFKQANRPVNRMLVRRCVACTLSMCRGVR